MIVFKLNKLKINFINKIYIYINIFNYFLFNKKYKLN